MPLELAELVDPMHTALVLQEVQNGVVGAGGALPALADAAREVGLVEHCAQLARAARGLGIPVFHCTAENRADGIGGNRNARLFAGVKKSPVKLAPGSAEVVPPDEIGVEPGDVLLPRYQGLGPMAGTQLDPMLRNCGVTTIVGVGVSVNVGMLDLVLDAVNLGYQVVLPADAVAGVPVDYAAAVLENTISLLATVTTTESVLDAWRQN